MAKYLTGHYDVSARRACRVIRATRSSTYYKTLRRGGDGSLVATAGGESASATPSAALRAND